MRQPEFWTHTDFASRAVAAVLAPAGYVYGASIAWKHLTRKPYRSTASVICVGNLTVGGSGKTPVAIAIGRMLIERSIPIAFLTRGYRRKSSGALIVDTRLHDASMVGDEALLLAAVAPTIVARDRAAGARLAESRGARVIVMDDGHQNFSLAKDLSIVVVDSGFAFGNGRIVPAGPLRENVLQGLARADAVVVMGSGDPRLVGFRGAISRARMASDRRFDGMRVVAFAGIGRPEKFFDTLCDAGAEIAERHSFEDHHVYSPAELMVLRERATGVGASLITTEKDFVRLNAREREGIGTLGVHAVFEDRAAIKSLLESLPGRVCPHR